MALHLGKTVRQLLSEMDSQELSEWMAFDQIEPLPDPYWASGMVASTMCNLWGKRSKPYKPKEFMPTYQVKPSPAQDRAILDALMAKQPPQNV